MKTSKITAISNEREAASYGHIPGKKRAEVNEPEDFTEDDDEFDIPLDADLEPLDDLELDDDDF